MKTISYVFSALLVTGLGPLGSAFAESLPDQPLEELRFFDGETLLDGEGTWSMEAGELVCTGQPRGYLVLQEEASEYVMSFEWKWEGEGGNSGVLVHAAPGTSGFRTWAQSIEVQLQTGMAGDIYAIGTKPGFLGEGSIFVAPGVPVVRLDRKTTAENPLGEWNHMQILAADGKLSIRVNGVLVNEITSVKPAKGAIALQSEGAPLRFRNIEIKNITATD